ncbi:MAG: 3-deoxy-7-phosphoheptulonate synthase [Candidatus Peregrinibacteria bacterium]
MLIVLRQKNDQPLITHIQNLLKKKYGCESHIIGSNGRVIAVPGDTTMVEIDLIKNIEGVRSVDRVDRPYKLASRERKDRTEIKLSHGVTIGTRGTLVVMAGPCSIESEAQLDETAALAKKHGATVLRGGAFKPRTGPYAFNGLGEDGLKFLKKAGEKYEMPVISEAMNEAQVDLMEKYVDIVQVGARNMQNYDLLRRLGKCRIPVLLKRGLAATLEEFLLAAEYILAGGNPDVMLCERGIRTFEEEVRFTLALGSVPALRELTHLPIIIDPSHAAGKARWIADTSRASVAIGADGLIIEIHPRPEEALSDGPQALDEAHWTECMEGIRAIAGAMGKKLA